MLIAPGLHLVDGKEGQRLSVVNVHVWERTDGGLTLIDAGMPGDAKKILGYVRSLGLTRLDRIIITHGDIDHVGGAAQIQSATQAKVVCHAIEKDVVEGRQPRDMGRSLPARVYAPAFAWVGKTVLRARPVEHVDELVLDKQVLLEGFQVVHTPGHTPGQIALFEPQRGILIAGDALMNRKNRLSLPSAIATPRMDIAKDSIRKLAALKGIQIICFGHGAPITENAAQRLEDFAASLDK